MIKITREIAGKMAEVEAGECVSAGSLYPETFEKQVDNTPGEEVSDPEMNRLAAGLHVAWRKYTESFGEPPHGTLQQLRALLCFLPKPLPEPEITRPCRWCDEGYPPILSSVSDQWIHPDTPVGRVFCGNRMEGK